MTARVIATSFALSAFAAALFVGAMAENSFRTIIIRAMIIMFVCYPIGRIVGGLATGVVDRHIKDYKKQNPMPGELNNDIESEPVGMTP